MNATKNKYSFLPADVGFNLKLQKTKISLKTLEADNLSVKYLNRKNNVSLYDGNRDGLRNVLRAAGYLLES